MKYFFTLSLVFCVCIGIRAQIFAVQSTSQLIPPYSVYLSDYATPGSEKLRVILVQRDLTQPSYQLRLVMEVMLNGKTILRTSRTFNPPPISLNPGIPTIISGADLAPYLDSRNIDFIGFSREQYERTRALPEGSYQINFTAYDFRRQDVVVSNVGSSFYYLSKNEPPLINFPACGSQVQMRTPQQIIFSWLPRNTASPNSAAETQYEFTLYETRPAGRNPNDVVASTQPILRTTVDNPQLIYGATEPMLMDNMKYVWRVRAIDREGKDAFRNNGYSEVCTFTYGGVDPNFSIGVVTGVQAEGETERRAKISWTKGDFDSYRVNYKKTGSGYEWFYDDVTKEKLLQDGTVNGELKVFDLEPDTEYETRIQGKKSGVAGGYSDIIKFRTQPLRVAHCGDAPPPPAENPGKPATSILVGTIIDADGFDIQLTQVESLGGGYFKGVGRVSVPYLGGAAFAVKFERLFINEDRVCGEGRIDFITQGAATMIETQMANVQLNAINKVKEANRAVWAGTDFYEKVFVYDQMEIEKVEPSGASMVNVYKKDGTVTANAEVMQVLVSVPEKAIIIQDKSGDQFVVEKDKATGAIKATKVEGGGLGSGSTTVVDSKAQISTVRTKEAKLIAEFLEHYEKQITDVIGASYEPDFPHGAGPMAGILLLPDCMPADHEKLGITKAYSAKTRSDETKLQAFLNRIFENKEHRELVALLANRANPNNLTYEELLSAQDEQNLEGVLCPYLVEGAKRDFGDIWWRAPYWERAAKILQEHLKDQGIYEEVTLTYGTNECKVTGVINLSEDGGAAISMEVTFSNKQSDAELWDILYNTYGIDFLVARDVTIETFSEWWWNYMAIKDDNLHHGKGWESASVKIFADILMAAPGTIQGWITDKHWRTGQDLAAWEHALGILDLIPAEAFAKASITAFVIKIGGKLIDVAKLSAPLQNFILSARTIGLKLLIKSKDEIIIFASNGTQQIGRFLNGVLQDLYWVYGGEKILSRLAGVKYLNESKKLVEGSIEIVEEGGKVGARIAKEFNVGERIAGIAIKQVKKGASGKYAIIGRSMGNAKLTGVKDIFEELKNVNKIDVEIFDASSLTGIWKTRFDEALSEFASATNSWTKRLTNQELMQLKMYTLNKEWGQKLIDEGFTILDMGDFNNQGFSVFYAMEKATIFK